MKAIAWRTAVVALAAVACLLAIAHVRGRIRGDSLPITVSRETTFLTGPLRADGTVDYVAAVNARLSEGVTPQNNAAVVFLELFNRQGYLPESVAAEYLQRLGVTSRDLKGPVYEGLDEWLDRNGLLKPPHPAPQRDTQQFEWSRPPVRHEALEHFEKSWESPWTREQYPVLAQWLDTQEEALGRLIEASRREAWYVPLISEKAGAGNWIWVSLPSIATHRRIAQAFLARSMLRIHRGDLAAASADLLALHRLARLHDKGFTSIEHILAQSIEQLAIDGALALARSPLLTAPAARVHREHLAALAPMRSSAEVFGDSERLWMLDTLAMLAQQAVRDGSFDVSHYAFLESDLGPLNWDLDWDWMLRKWNKDYDQLVANLRIQDPHQRKAAMEQFNERYRLDHERARQMMPRLRGRKALLWTLTLDPQKLRRVRTWAVYHHQFTRFVPSVGPATDLDQRCEIRRDLARVALALTEFQRKTGSYPASLDVLAPDYLKAVPQDIFNGGKPLRYSRTDDGYLLYSVGIDLNDDGGDDDKDLVVRMPFKAPAAAGE